MEKKTATVLGRTMAYVDEGTGEPIVFLHGNPTSSYLWRNILPQLSSSARCVAPDLIGMGDSDKLPDSGPGSYRFVEHRRYLDALLEQLGVDDGVVLVTHDWGSGLGFDWANRHRGAVRGIVYMEAIVRPMGWAEWPEASRRIFEGMRSEAGEELVLEKNVFVERILPASLLDPVPDVVMDVYRAPFREPGESRRPMLNWPREIPLDGEPADVAEIVAAYGAWLQECTVPKLFINVAPGFLSPVQADFCRTFPNQTEVSVRGSHFVQEDSAEDIAEAISAWLPASTG